MSSPVCKSCRQPILWRLTPNGKAMPLDYEPTSKADAGTYRIIDNQNCQPAEPMFDPPETAYHMNHRATCPVADQFKTRKDTTHE
jgi:hypothetical protein